jgi:hypothetical protein
MAASSDHIAKPKPHQATARGSFLTIANLLDRSYCRHGQGANMLAGAAVTSLRGLIPSRLIDMRGQSHSPLAPGFGYTGREITA